MNEKEQKHQHEKFLDNIEYIEGHKDIPERLTDKIREYVLYLQEENQKQFDRGYEEGARSASNDILSSI